MNRIAKLKKKGFTLIEILIVIAIISTIIMVSVSSYGIVRKKVQLDVAANTLESVIVEAREKTRSGIYQKTGELTEGASYCFGILVENEGYISLYKAPYNRLSPKNNQCDKAQGELVKNVEHDDRLIVKGIEFFGDEITDSIEIYFAPPKSVIEIPSTLIGFNEPLLKVVVGFEDAIQASEKRMVVLNLLTGNVYTDKYEE
ncbi:prepilin-type N-terminal cleavage/methylation domain-containing protein [Patescibacteria group bacterium]